MYRHDVVCKRWPYVDPYREAQADQIQLENKTTSRIKICARQGDEFEDIVGDMAAEKEILPQEQANEPAK
jgi:capsid protein